MNAVRWSPTLVVGALGALALTVSSEQGGAGSSVRRARAAGATQMRRL